MPCVLLIRSAEVQIVWTAAVLVVVVIMAVGPSSAYVPRYQLSRPPQLSSSSIRGSSKNGVGSVLQHHPPMTGATHKNDAGGEDLRQEWTSSPYCRNSVDYHEEFVRMSSGAPIGASKVEVFGAVLKSHVQALRRLSNRQVDLVFLVDSSSSVSEANFRNELKFVQRLLADFTVDRYTTRVAVITFSSTNRVLRHIDYISTVSDDNHKCSLLEEAMPKIPFKTGSTYTYGAMKEAQVVFKSARPDAKKVVFLLTDGYSNTADPKPVAEELRNAGVEIFTFGIKEGNFIELCDMASDQKHEHVYILNTFEEFESLARRALHEDLHVGNYVVQNTTKCDSLCTQQHQAGMSSTRSRQGCCDGLSSCACGTHTGKYECICKAGYYGSGLFGECFPCPEGTYKNYSGPGDKSTCYPCPDIHHTSPAGSVSERQCRCRSGYQPTVPGSNACAAKTCPPIVAPANAYFVQGMCSNDVNAACGIRCKAGYLLIGTSLRLCTEEGVWSGSDVTCEVKHCPKLNTPANGNMACTKDDFSYDTQCYFTCNPGYKLVGSKSQSCLAFAAWSGIPPKCREMKCPELSVLVDGRISPETCSTRESPFGTVCSLTCNRGYKLTGSHSRQCSETGRWSPDDESQCVDVTPPVIVCPSNMVVDASRDESFGQATWAVPNALDNSGFVPTLTVVPALLPPVSLTIGQHTIIYTAEDVNKNKARCSFTITVQDRQPPRIDRCQSPPPFTRRSADDRVTWYPPLFSDNSHQPVTVIQTPNSIDVFPIGTTRIHYTASDPYNNHVTCVIEIVVQEHACTNHQVPSNGNLTCRPNSNGVECVPYCNVGYGFAFSPADKYYCDYDVGHWMPKDKWPVKDCSLSTSSTTVRQKSVLRFKTNSICKDRFNMNQLESSFEKKMKTKVANYCHSNMICEVEHFEAKCSDRDGPHTTTDDDIGSNVINTLPVESRSEEKHRRRRRRAHAPANDIVGIYFKRDGTSINANDSGTIFVGIDLTGRPRKTFGADIARRDELVSGVEAVMERIRQDAYNGEFDSVMIDGGMGPVSVIDVRKREPTFVCPPGSVLQNYACVACPAGTFFNVVLETCMGCPQGTYQPQEGSLTCLECPDHTSTASNNSKSIQQCRGQCLPGSFSSNRVDPCETCAVGSYQPHYAQTTCIPCHSGMTTWRRGSRKSDDCGVMCPEGQVSKTGLEPCFPCPRGYFQPDRGKSSCFVCPGSVNTRRSGSTDITDCDGLAEVAASFGGKSFDLSDVSVPTTQLVVNECFSEPCINGATCVTLDSGYTCKCDDGWTGLTCDVEINECLSQPCLNNATCSDMFNGFNCTCPDGYTGNVCDVNVDECSLLEPCLNNATCVDLVNSFRCECTEGFSGLSCDFNIDDCASDPCKNGGQCVDGVADYECRCLPGFQGISCEIETDECLSTPCLNNGTCNDGVNTFTCACKDGYGGNVCQSEINECLSSPCLNNATCLDLEAKYICQCQPSYSGVHCEEKLNSTFDLVFAASGITNYASLDGAVRHGDLSALTVAMWIQSDDKQNQGTPLSYATSKTFNALTLTDYSGFVVYIDNEAIVTDVAVNDGYWHHVTLTFQGRGDHAVVGGGGGGVWKIYVDGQGRANGTTVNVTRVEGGGVFVIGQEQDSRGAGFSSSESFIGGIHALNVWNYALTAEEVFGVATNCSENEGNLVAWPDFLAGVNGHVVRRDSIVCRGCAAPNQIQQGEYQLTGTGVNDSVTYSCNVGYSLQGPPTAHCHFTSRWIFSGTGSVATSDGEEDEKRKQPRCTRIVCQPPPPVENARLYSPSFVYGASPDYRCKEGYRINQSAPFVCGLNGTWTGTLPQCQLITCSDLNITLSSPLLVDHNRTTGYRPTDTARFKCRLGYRLIGPQVVRCSWFDRAKENASWDTNMPSCEEILCRDPPAIYRARLTNSSSADGAAIAVPVDGHVTYECEAGYKMATGSNRLTCDERGQWSSVARPHCELITCRQPEIVANGSVTVLNHFLPIVVGTRITYRCNTGFIASGLLDMVCLDDGQWNGSLPRCLPVACPPPGEIPHGTASGREFTFEGRVQYSCDAGYVIDGQTDVMTCSETGEWTPAKRPACVRRQCPVPQPIGNGRFVVKNADSSTPDSTFAFGDLVEYSCIPGYQLIGADHRTCIENGTWSLVEPSCVEITCRPPTPVDNAVIIGGTTKPTASPGQGSESYNPGTVVRYRCAPGYAIDGKDTRSCRSVGTWTGPIPRCIAINCTVPAEVDHGWIVIDEDNLMSNESNRIITSVGSTVEYRCEEGYKLSGGSSVRTCTDGRRWTGTDPLCVPSDESPVVVCLEPEEISHGTVEGTDFSVGSTIRYVCDLGFQVIDEEFVTSSETARTCLANRTWSGASPECRKIDCGRPPDSFPNGRIIGTDFSYNASITYVCDDGYVLKDSTSTRRACKLDGAWSDPIPICERVTCPSLPQPPHAEVISSGVDPLFGDRVTYSCRPGYRLDGSATRGCQADRSWSGNETRCVEVECPRPEDPKHGRVVLDEGPFYGKPARYECDSGYSLDGPEMRRCDANGQWSGGDQPRCTKIICGKPPKIDYGLPVNDQVEMGDEPQYACDQGYALIQPERFVCTSAGNYTGGQPRCVRVECPKPETVPNADIDAPGNTLGDVMRYRCHAGFEPVGRTERDCTRNGTWSSQPPRCVRIVCPVPDRVQNAIFKSTTYEFGSKVEYVCDSGHSLSFGSLERTCLANMTWSGQAPVCERPACSRPNITYGFVAASAGDQAIDEHVRNINRFVSGLTVEFDCELGFRLIGNRALTCGDNGTWSGSLPSCERVLCGDPSIANSILQAPKGYTFGNRILIGCEIGYELDGAGSATCLASGNWSIPMPACRLIACEDPPEVDNSDVIIVHSPNRGFGYSVGITIGYRCLVGYRLVGVAQITCLTTRVWSHGFPSCVTIACTPPLIEGNSIPEVVDARDSYAYGEAMSFRCESDGSRYELIGNDTITCNGTNEWNGSVPECRLRVCPPVELRYGVVRSRGANSSLSNIDGQLAVGVELTFSCNDGYRLSGNSSVVCTDELVWSSSPPRCLLTVCPLPIIPNGRTVVVSDSGIADEGEETDSYPIGVKILVGCLVGYQLPAGATSSSVCAESAEWSPELPAVCDLVTCPTLIISGGTVRVNGNQVANQSARAYSYLDRVVVDCQIGYTLVGRSHIACESSGTWSDKIPVCEPILCPEPNIPNGSVRLFDAPSGITAAYAFGDIVFVQCDDGYHLDGVADNICKEDGTWAEPFPSCVAVRCPALLIGNATHDGPEAPEYGVRVTVRCLVGFELFGDAVLNCQANGRWSGVTPVCWRIACKLPAIANARIMRASQLASTGRPGVAAGQTGIASATGGVSFGEEVIVECVEGFQITDGNNSTDPSRLTCGADKVWKPRLPTCRRRECPNPQLNNTQHLEWKTQSPESTKAIASGEFVFGTRLVLDCQAGYRLIDGSPKSMTCESTGQWSIVSSGVPSTTNGSVISPRTQPRATCSRVYCPVPNVTNGYVERPTVDGTYSFSDSIRIRCREGFDLVGEIELFCQPNAEWTAEMPRCRRRSCSDSPPVIENGYAAFGLPVPPSKSMFEDVVVYRCNIGFEFDETDNVTCTQSGNWSESRPTCHPVRCPPPDIILHGTYMTNGYGYRSLLRYACLSGYRLNGVTDHDCLANGTWSGLTPTCDRVRCPPKPFVPRADLVRVNADSDHTMTLDPSTPYFFGDSLLVTCHQGYLLNGLAAIECLENASWSRVQAECSIVNCGEPPHVRLAEVVVLADGGSGSGRDFNSTTGYVCQTGYRLTGALTNSTCQADGSWTAVEAACAAVRCTDPPIPSHGSLVFDLMEVRTPQDLSRLWPDGFHFRDRVAISCDVGYELQPGASPVLTCGSDARWDSSTEPRCVLVLCNRPPTVVNVVYRGLVGEPVRSLYQYGQAIEVHCESGYRRIAKSSEGRRDGNSGGSVVLAVCQADRRWNSTDITCQRIVCPTPRPVHNGRVVTGTDLDFGARIEYQCMDGYKLIGERYRKCGENGTWDQLQSSSSISSSSYCVPINCSEPETPPNGHMDASGGRTFGSVLLYRCREGYQLHGPASISCLVSGVWNATFPTCLIVSCGNPPPVENAEFDNNGKTFESTAVYRCRTGYEMADGGKHSTSTRVWQCASSGLWTGPIVRCNRVTCPKLTSPENGFTTGSDVEYDAVVLYSCRAGYALLGNVARRCLADRTWNGSQPTCRTKSCSTPSAPSNGRLVGFAIPPKLQPGGSVEFACDFGYQLNGSRWLRCNEDERWSDMSPRCERVTCNRPPPNVANANVTISTGGPGIDNRTSFPSIESSPFYFGDIVRYACLHGYRQRGPETIRCEIDGAWSDRGRTLCERIRCPDPPIIRHAKSVPSGYAVGDVVYYVCNDGFDLTGNNLLECTSPMTSPSSEASWTGSTPSCEPVTCGVVPVIPHATTIVHRTTFGSRATYECNRGFQLRGGAVSAVAECKANRTWAYVERPACVPVDCGTPPQSGSSSRAAGTALNFERTTFNSVATYYCLEGFRFAHYGKDRFDQSSNDERSAATKITIRCGENGRWNSTEVVICERIKCPEPDRIMNGRYQLSYGNADENGVDDGLTFGRDVQFSCNAGYRLVGDVVRTCQPDGSWSGNQPNCELIYCEAPNSPTNGNSNTTGRHYGAMATYWCMPGYVLVGNDTAFCELDGNWSDKVPECVTHIDRRKLICNPLPVIDNAVDIDNMFLLGDTVQITCRAGYQPSGPLEVTCQDDFTWTEPRAQCLRIECRLPRVDSRTVTIHGGGRRFYYLDRATYTCRMGLVPATSPTLTCTETGEWDRDPHCVATCKFPCQNGGTCTAPNRCKCLSGYGGRFCETANCILPCLNGGHCSAPYTCDCPYGFSGNRCERPVCVKPCQNGGTCVNANRCSCPHGFVPPFCEKHRHREN